MQQHIERAELNKYSLKKYVYGWMDNMPSVYDGGFKDLV